MRRVRMAMVEVRSSLLTSSVARRDESVGFGVRTCSLCRKPGHNAATCGRSPPAVAPKKPGLVKRNRVDGHNHCSVCGELGHNMTRHDGSSASTRAAVLVRDDGLTFEDAAARFGITRQAVQQTYRRRYPAGPTPAAVRGRGPLRRLVILSSSGRLSLSEVAEQAGCTYSTASSYLRKRGILCRQDWRIDHGDIATATAIIESGGSYQDAANAIGSSDQRLADAMRARGVHSKANGRGRMDGRTGRAVDRVIAGSSVPDACRAEKCATPAVYMATSEIRKSRKARK